MEKYLLEFKEASNQQYYPAGMIPEPAEKSDKIRSKQKPTCQLLRRQR
jgi:hypothetical protein